MLWPEGPAHQLASIGSFFDPPLEEPVVSFCVSRAQIFAAVITDHVVALLRLRPLCPVALYVQPQDKSEELGVNRQITVSPNGAYVAVATSKNKIIIYKVLPLEDLKEVMRVNKLIIPGPGEGIGIRELSLDLLTVVHTDMDIRGVIALEKTLIIVGPRKFQASTYGEGLSVIPVELPGDSLDEIQSVALCRPLPTFIVLMKSGRTLLVNLNDTARVLMNNATCIGVNIRLNKVAIASETKIYLFKLGLEEKPVEIVLPAEKDLQGRVTTLEWSPLGECLMVGREDGYNLLSPLGFLIHSESFKHGVAKVQWFLNAESFFIQSGSEIVCQNILRWPGSGSGVGRPVLFGNGRIQVFHDPDKTGLPTSPWLMIPMPTHYMASNWPILEAACSDDFRYVAIAGTAGLMYFSVVRRQWKEISDRDMAVRGGIVWHGHELVAAFQNSEGAYVLQMFSPISRDGKAAEQVVATEKLTSAPVTLNLRKHTLVLLEHSNILRIYDLSDNDICLEEELPMTGIINSPSRVRNLVVIDKFSMLLLDDDNLEYLVSEENDRTHYTKTTLAAPVEQFHLEGNGRLWTFNGREVVLVDLAEPSLPLVVVPIDAYPIGINQYKGYLVTIAGNTVPSHDNSFVYSRPTSQLVVYLPDIFISLKDTGKYSHFSYYNQALETMIYRVIMNNDEASHMLDLETAVSLIKQSKGWQRLIGQCARKIETKFWSRLFGTVGQTPKELFDQCLADGDLEAANEYLMILASEGADPTGPEAQRLYKQALQTRRFNICKELCQFLLKVGGSETLESFISKIAT